MKIHLHSRQGLYEVETYSNEIITVSTKRFTFTVPVSDFKSFAGGNWNFDVSKEQMDTFLSIVQPETYKKQVEMENEILSLAKRIDMIDTFNTPVTTPVVEEDVDDDIYDPMEPTKEEYEKWWRQEADKNTELNNKMRSIAYQVYSQNLDLSDFQNNKGIKFIIQVAHNDVTDCRMCFDPYGFVDNFHSSISAIYRSNKYFTANGGWLKVIDNNVYLYYKSGDYGVYDDITAIACAKRLFPGKEIYSYAGQQWNPEWEDDNDDLPF